MVRLHLDLLHLVPINVGSNSHVTKYAHCWVLQYRETAQLAPLMHWSVWLTDFTCNIEAIWLHAVKGDIQQMFVCPCRGVFDAHEHAMVQPVLSGSCVVMCGQC